MGEDISSIFYRGYNNFVNSGINENDPTLSNAGDIVTEADNEKTAKRVFISRLVELETLPVGTDANARTVKIEIIKLMGKNPAKFPLTAENIGSIKETIKKACTDEAFRNKFFASEDKKMDVLFKELSPALAVNEGPKVTGNNINEPGSNSASDDVELAKTFIGLWIKNANADQIWSDKMINKDEAKALGISNALFDLIDRQSNTKGIADGTITVGEIELFNKTIEKYMQAFGFDQTRAIDLYNKAPGYEMVHLDIVIKTGDAWGTGDINGVKIVAGETKIEDLKKQLNLNSEIMNALKQKYPDGIVANIQDFARFLAALPLISKLDPAIQKDCYGITASLPKFKGPIDEGSILKYLTGTSEENKKVNEKTDFQALCEEALKKVYESDPGTSKPTDKLMDSPDFTSAITSLEQALEDASKESDQIVKYQNVAKIMGSLDRVVYDMKKYAEGRISAGKQAANTALVTQGENLQKDANAASALIQAKIEEAVNTLGQTIKADNNPNQKLIDLYNAYNKMKATSVVGRVRELYVGKQYKEALKLLEDNKDNKKLIDDVLLESSNMQDGYATFVAELTRLAKANVTNSGNNNKVVNNENNNVVNSGVNSTNNSKNKQKTETNNTVTVNPNAQTLKDAEDLAQKAASQALPGKLVGLINQLKAKYNALDAKSKGDLIAYIKTLTGKNKGQILKALGQ
jgi:hypothetical protein